MVFLCPLNLILYLFSPCLAVLWNFLSFTLWSAGPPSSSICPVSTLSPALLLSLAETPPARKDFIPCPARFSVDRHCLADRGCGCGYACLFHSHVSQDPIPWGRGEESFSAWSLEQYCCLQGTPQINTWWIHLTEKDYPCQILYEWHVQWMSPISTTVE